MNFHWLTQFHAIDPLRHSLYYQAELKKYVDISIVNR